MNNKIRKALDSIYLEYRECERCTLFRDIELGEGFIVNLRDMDVYLELTDDGILIWDLNTSEFLNKIDKSELYIMMFKLGSCLQFMNM